MPISTCDAGALILVTDLHLSIQRTLTLTNEMTELKVEWDWDRSFLGEDFVCLFVCLHGFFDTPRYLRKKFAIWRINIGVGTLFLCQ